MNFISILERDKRTTEKHTTSKRYLVTLMIVREIQGRKYSETGFHKNVFQVATHQKKEN